MEKDLRSRLPAQEKGCTDSYRSAQPLPREG
jgi:hypothetical protein